MGLTIVFYGTILFASTLTRFLLLSWCFIQDFGTVLLHQIFRIGGTTAATFDGIATDDFAEFVMLWEMLFDKLLKLCTNICLYSFIIWQIKPHNFSVPVLFFTLEFIKFQGYFKFTFTYGFFINSFSFNKFFFVARKFWNHFEVHQSS